MIQKNENLVVFTKNKNGETFSIPTKQRALVLQGGGALVYYEIGVLQSLCVHLFNNTKSKDENDILKEGKNINVSKLNHDNQLKKTDDNIISEHNGDQFF